MANEFQLSSLTELFTVSAIAHYTDYPQQ